MKNENLLKKLELYKQIYSNELDRMILVNMKRLKKKKRREKQM